MVSGGKEEIPGTGSLVIVRQHNAADYG